MADKKYLAVINNGTEDLYLQDLEAQASIEEIKETIKNGSSYIGKFVSAVVDGETVTTLNDGDAPTSITTTKGTYVPGTPADGQTQLNNGDYTIVAGASGDPSLEFMWDGDAFSEFGSTSVLKGLAFKDSASGSYTPAGTNAASAVTLSGEAKSKMVTTSVYGVGGEETVHDTPTLNTTDITGVNGSTTTHDTPTLNTTDIVGIDGSTTTHDTPTLNTTNITGVEGSTTTHDTPTLNTTDIIGINGSTTTHDTPTLNTTNVKEVDTFSQGTLPSMSYDATNKKLTFNPGVLASLSTKNTAVGTSLTAGSEVAVPVAAAAATAVGTSLTAGAAVTVPVAAAAATAVGTSLTAGSEVTVPVAAAAATAVGISLTAGTAKTVATKASAATTVATGALDAEGAGAEVVTQSNNAGTAAAQTFSGTAATITVE